MSPYTARESINLYDRTILQRGLLALIRASCPSPAKLAKRDVISGKKPGPSTCGSDEALLASASSVAMQGSLDELRFCTAGLHRPLRI